MLQPSSFILFYRLGALEHTRSKANVPAPFLLSLSSKSPPPSQHPLHFISQHTLTLPALLLLVLSSSCLPHPSLSLLLQVPDLSSNLFRDPSLPPPLLLPALVFLFLKLPLVPFLKTYKVTIQRKICQVCQHMLRT